MGNDNGTRESTTGLVKWSERPDALLTYGADTMAHMHFSCGSCGQGVNLFVENEIDKMYFCVNCGAGHHIDAKVHIVARILHLGYFTAEERAAMEEGYETADEGTPANDAL